MIEYLDLKKCVQFFLCNPNNYLCIWYSYECERKQLFKKIYNVICNLVWLWEKTITL
jgi:hypothetical protein